MGFGDCMAKIRRGFHFFVLVFVFLFSGVNFVFADLLVSQPDVGGELHILLENGGNATATIVSPTGKQTDITLDNGQASVIADEPGRWKVTAGGIQKIAIVGGEGIPLIAPQEQNDGIGMHSILLGISLFVIFAAMLSAMWYFFVRTPKMPPAPSFAKLQEGGKVKLEFVAGADVVENLRISDNVGDGWAGKPITLARKKLMPYEKASVTYEFGGSASDAVAEFSANGKKMRLQSGSAAPELLPSGKPETKKGKRKLAKL